LTGSLDPATPYPGLAAEGRRGRAGGEKEVRLPDGWLDSRTLDGADSATLAAAELDHSGG
ncbi:MAG: hypothetical protein LBL01_02925, partial [Bifidobacteriaceae bacterium]|nr:hypothetical protein [Bifidobacteriaceae bacterium]